MAETVVIITGSEPSPEVLRSSVPDEATIIAADRGLDHALAAGLRPSIVVGDLDSVSDEGEAWARSHADLRLSPTDKAATDTELAIESAAATGDVVRLILIGGPDGTRLDHTIAALGALGTPAMATIERVEAWWNEAYVRVIHPNRTATLDRLVTGRTFSVLAMHGPATGVTVTGARWPLDGVALPAMSGWGVSNEVAEPPATVAVEHGVVTVIVPPGGPR